MPPFAALGLFAARRGHYMQGNHELIPGHHRMTFWITAALLSLFVAAVLGLTLLRWKGTGEHPAAYDLRVYRDQLREVDRDLARGVIGPGDAERIRSEVGRRVLAADLQLQQAATGSGQPRGATLLLACAVTLSVIGGTMGLYQVLGSPGMRDLALSDRIAQSDRMRAERPSQAQAEARLPASPSLQQPAPEFAALMDKLRKTVAERPDDLQGYTLLARNEASLGNLTAAHTAQAQVIRIKGDAVTAGDHLTLADLMINAARGYVSPEAEAALREALALDPTNKVARFYAGLMMLQNDRPDTAFRMWSSLLEEGPATAPWIAPIRSQIEEIAWRAGVKYTLPAAVPSTALPGPSASDMADAAQMNPEDRQTMIRDMVSNLSQRLATEGGTPEEWARLISAYGVLGETDRAAAIWREAQETFSTRPEALAIVRQGAEQAGVTDMPAAAAPLTGPTAQDVAEAMDMAAADRQAMIASMVERLSERLASEGGSAAEWVRLIGAQNVLGETDAARAAYEAARAAYADDAAALASITDAARAAGLIE